MLEYGQVSVALCHFRRGTRKQFPASSGWCLQEKPATEVALSPYFYPPTGSLASELGSTQFPISSRNHEARSGVLSMRKRRGGVSIFHFTCETLPEG
jgi:hypothetical protein